MSVRMRIRAASAEDCRAIAEVHVEAWQHAYRGMLPEQYLSSLSVAERESMWRRMVDEQPAHLLLACTASQVLGFVAFGASRDEDAQKDQAEIWAIYVKAEYWSTGAGRLLWLEALQRIVTAGYKTISLWVLAGNERAIRFYGRAGFVADPQARKAFALGGVTLEELRYVRYMD
jgi:ribosomal protein S18 acetylase RimI-like enzyme